jgi:hypothetical protein
LAADEPRQPALRGGDWRQAAANIREELASHFNGRAATG